MMKIIRNFFISAILGFIAPSIAFATISQPAPVTDFKHLFELAYEDVEGAVSFALAERGAGSKISAVIHGNKQEALFSYNSPINVEIRGLKFDKPTSRWNANLVMLSEGKIVSAMPVAGRFDEIVSIPVLKRQVHSGSIINEKDIEIRDYSVSRTRSDTVSDKNTLIGKSPLRTISAGRPIYEREIAKPSLIKKESLVQVYYRSPGVEITTTGQAMESGTKGKIISVRTLPNKKLVRALIVDADSVVIVNSSMKTANKYSGARYAAK